MLDRLPTPSPASTRPPPPGGERTRLLVPRPDPSARLRLLCFPHAGGGASLFRGWPEALPGVEVAIVQRDGAMPPPEPGFDERIDALAAALGPELERPFACFGHSLGALLAFELSRRAVRAGRPGPAHLFVAAFRAPHLPCRFEALADLPDEAFAERVHRDFGGIPEAVRRDPELLALSLPKLRADVALHESYVFRPGPRLDCPISVFGGSRDAHVDPEELGAWADHTSRRLSLRLLPGGHLFASENPRPLLAWLGRELAVAAKALG